MTKQEYLVLFTRAKKLPTLDRMVLRACRDAGCSWDGEYGYAIAAKRYKCARWVALFEAAHQRALEINRLESSPHGALEEALRRMLNE
jgi:hypothetical protein